MFVWLTSLRGGPFLFYSLSMLYVFSEKNLKKTLQKLLTNQFNCLPLQHHFIKHQTFSTMSVIIIISIPHQIAVSSQSWPSEKAFIEDMEWDSDFKINDFDSAIEHYTRNLNSSIIIRTKSDLEKALEYPFSEHKGLQVRKEAEKIKEESLWYFGQ